MQDKNTIFENLRDFCTEEEFNPIKDKVKRYLQIYTGGVEFESFSFTVMINRIESINFYIDKEQDIYRRLHFNQFGDLISVHHFVGDKCTTGLGRISIDHINGEPDESLEIYKK